MTAPGKSIARRSSQSQILIRMKKRFVPTYSECTKGEGGKVGRLVPNLKKTGCGGPSQRQQKPRKGGRQK